MSNTKPVKKFRAGAISASIFMNTGKRKNGDEIEFPSIALQRVYKDKSGEWKNTTSLRLNDLPRAAMLVNKAYEHLVLKDVDTGAADEEEVVM